MEKTVDTFRPQAVLLDMDGLMLDTEHPTVGLWPIAGRDFNVDIPQEIVMQIIGLNEGSIKALFLKTYGEDFPYEKLRDAQRVLAKQKFEREGIALRPGLLELLDCLAERNIPYSVATSTNRESALWKLAHTGIKERFPVLVCGDEVKNGKPSPDIFLAAASKLGVPPSGCVGFEDSGPGLFALKAAGIPSIFVQDLVQPSPEALATVWRRYSTLAEAVEVFLH
ncbi:MAG: HAD family phosphatase [Treponema sp.]|jgi:HAD superfamily hydrolase (TIGR01509 family)|nr:HAD family phosphatase [Treponema sp.]